MAKRRPGGQPGNRNAVGHRGANAFSKGKAAVKKEALARAYKAGARGVTVTGQTHGLEVRAHVSVRKAKSTDTAVRVSAGSRAR